jgi:8-oxo-dGTP pyrophosphatase MutT (NUDIX family)
MSMLRAPISIKGIVFEDARVWLRRNERDEWELPGGKLDEGEQPGETVVRELREELGFAVQVIEIVQAYVYTIATAAGEARPVLVVTYLCELKDRVGEFEIQGEAGEAHFERFTLDEVSGLKMPQFYKEAIRKASAIQPADEG